MRYQAVKDFIEKYKEQRNYFSAYYYIDDTFNESEVSLEHVDYKQALKHIERCENTDVHGQTHGNALIFSSVDDKDHDIYDFIKFMYGNFYNMLRELINDYDYIIEAEEESEDEGYVRPNIYSFGIGSGSEFMSEDYDYYTDDRY